MSAPLFEYRESLQRGKIRVLKVLPGDFGSPIVGSLSVKRLDKSHEYEALSYCWGDSTLSKELHINGKRFLVTTSVYEALQHLRSTTTTLHIWIDQVCIDQSNIAEKNVQVQQMGAIYKRATRSRIWLGPATPGFEDALDIVSGLGTTDNAPEYFLRHYGAILDVYTRPWFYRLWVLQEVVLSRSCTVTYGHASCRLDDIAAVDHIHIPWTEELRNRLEKTSWGLGEAFDALRNVLRLALLRQSWDPSDTQLVDMATAYGRWLKCTDPRDHLYALIGIVSPDEQQAIHISYQENVDRIFIDFTTRNILDARGGLNNLIWYHTEDEERYNVGNDLPDWLVRLPSWVPDWTLTSINTKFPYEAYGAGGPKDVRLVPSAFTHAGKCLHVTGVTVCNIKDLQRHDRSEGWSHELWIEVEARALEAEPCPYPTTDAKVQAFGRTFVADYNIIREPGSALPESCERWPGEDTRFTLKPWLYGTEIMPSDPTFAEFFFLFFENTRPAANRSFIITDTGHFALGPHASRLGDEIVVFEGVNMPFILRKRDLGDHYQMIGPAYVHGIMDGEVMKAVQRGQYQLREFVID